MFHICCLIYVYFSLKEIIIAVIQLKLFLRLAPEMLYHFYVNLIYCVSKINLDVTLFLEYSAITTQKNTVYIHIVTFL